LLKKKNGKHVYQNKKLAKLDKNIMKNKVLQRARKLVNLKFARNLASIKPRQYRSRAEKCVRKNPELTKFFTELAKKKNTTFRKICGQNFGYKINIDTSAPDGFTREKIVNLEYPLEKERKKEIVLLNLEYLNLRAITNQVLF